MNITISQTEAHVARYPLHSHDHWEIMLYTEGEGQMRLETGAFPFVPGTIIVMPPGVVHGSVSDKPFRNISIGGPFEQPLPFDAPLCLMDDEKRQGTAMAQLLYQNRENHQPYVATLLNAYVQFILQLHHQDRPVHAAVSRLVEQLTERACDAQLCVADLLKQSGYAPDYLRQQFRQVVGAHPLAFVTRVRMNRARLYLDIYGHTLSLAQIAERCGYQDYIYFSKQFKRHFGQSPSRYRADLRMSVGQQPQNVEKADENASCDG